jgi:hypothetical protein
MAASPPDLAQKGDNRGFAAGAGDGDNRLRLTRIEPRRRMRKRGAHIIDDNKRQSAISVTLRHNSACAARLGVGDKRQTIAGMAGDREKDLTRTNGAAVRRQTSDLNRANRRIEIRYREKVGEAHQ